MYPSFTFPRMYKEAEPGLDRVLRSPCYGLIAPSYVPLLLSAAALLARCE